MGIEGGVIIGWIVVIGAGVENIEGLCLFRHFEVAVTTDAALPQQIIALLEPTTLALNSTLSQLSYRRILFLLPSNLRHHIFPLDPVHKPLHTPLQQPILQGTKYLSIDFCLLVPGHQISSHLFRLLKCFKVDAFFVLVCVEEDYSEFVFLWLVAEPW